MTSLTIKHIKFQDGERHKLLVDDQSGVPLYYPSLYVTAHIRANGCSVSTIEGSLTALKMLYAWQAHQGIDLEALFSKGDLLRPEEIASLARFCSRFLSPPERQQGFMKMPLSHNAGRLRTHSTPNVSAQTQYMRLSVISRYLAFLAEVLRGTQSGLKLNSEVRVMVECIHAYRPKTTSISTVEQIDKSLDVDLISKVLEFLKPGHPENPFADSGVQYRNHLIVTLLRYLGIRRGELLNLRVEDVDISSATINIVRRADSTLDDRRFQPLVKTRQRKIPISEPLQKLITDYIIHFRAKYRQSKRHPYLFVAHKAGPSQGKPLTNSSFGKLVRTIQNMTCDCSSIHAHAFRHNWNYEFSNIIDSTGGVSPEQEQKMRAYLMGWSETSDAAITYNKRHIREKAAEAALAYQKSLKSQRV